MNNDISRYTAIQWANRIAAQEMEKSGLRALLDEKITGERKMEWISTKDRLPEPYESVWFVLAGEVYQGRYDEQFKKWRKLGEKGLYRRATHWQPFIIPSPPKEIE